MKTIWKCETTVTHPSRADRTPSRFTDWYEGSKDAALIQHAEDMHRYGLPVDRCASEWAECDAETLKPIA